MKSTMINKIQLSIIVPMYNAENFIEECIESILSEAKNDIELPFIFLSAPSRLHRRPLQRIYWNTCTFYGRLYQLLRLPHFLLYRSHRFCCHRPFPGNDDGLTPRSSSCLDYRKVPRKSIYCRPWNEPVFLFNHFLYLKLCF